MVDRDTQQDVTTIMVFLILFSPWGMMLHGDTIGIYWLLWGWIIRPELSYVEILNYPDPFFMSVIFVRAIFGVLVIRLYSERTTLKRVLTLGIIAEYSIVFVALLQGSLVYLEPDWPYVMIGIPTPFMLIGTFFLLRYRPPPIRDDSWFYKSRTEKLEPISSPNPEE